MRHGGSDDRQKDGEQMRDHPDIAEALRTGYPLGYSDREAFCPVCSEELAIGIDTVYIRDGECLGCCNCIDVKYAGDDEDE